MDFVHDRLATGRKIRVLTVVDTFSRFSPVVDPRFSYRAGDVVATLERVCAKVGYPRTIRVDQGSEFVSRDLDPWAYAKGVTLDFSRPGKPTDNAYIEAFNGRFRSECLNAHWFLTLADAAEKMEAWLRYYNKDRPHGGSGRSPRLRCTASAERPARRRNEGRKLQLPAVQRWGAAPSDYPHFGCMRSAPSTMSMRRDQPRHITALPGGGSRARAR
jgi:transposase InsO family protein